MTTMRATPPITKPTVRPKLREVEDEDEVVRTFAAIVGWLEGAWILEEVVTTKEEN